MLQTSVASHLANPRQIFLRLADVIKQHLDRQQNGISEAQEDRVNMIKALRSLELQTLPPPPPKTKLGLTCSHQNEPGAKHLRINFVFGGGGERKRCISRKCCLITSATSNPWGVLPFVKVPRVPARPYVIIMVDGGGTRTKHNKTNCS